MTKRTILDTYPMYSFYRPHERSATWFTNEVFNASTGEFEPMPSMTKQSHVAECDLNRIMKQFNPREQALIMSRQAQGGSYTDLPDEFDFQEAQNINIRAIDAFSSLSSTLRTRFENDPAQFLAFMSNPENTDEAVKLGLASKRATDAPIEPQATSTASNTAKLPEGSKTAPAA